LQFLWIPTILRAHLRRTSFLGFALSELRNTGTAGVISTVASRVTVRFIRTDEHLMIARSVCRILKTDAGNEKTDYENQHCHIGTATQETRRDRR
jgi:hypothetical protein